MRDVGRGVGGWIHRRDAEARRKDVCGWGVGVDGSHGGVTILDCPLWIIETRAARLAVGLRRVMS